MSIIEKTQHAENANKKEPENLALADVICAFSYALDLTEGQPPGHCLRCCWLGTHLGNSLVSDREELWDLYYTLLLKDAGCSSNAARLCQLYGSDDRKAKRDYKLVNSDNFGDIASFVLHHTGLGGGLKQRFKNLFNLALRGDQLANELVSTRCERGADIARQLGFNERVAYGIQCLDEHWDGNGLPTKLQGDELPLSSQIALLVQVVDVFHSMSGKQAALDEIKKRSGTWFKPSLVNAFEALAKNTALWEGLTSNSIESLVKSLEPQSRSIEVSEDYLDAIATAFGQVVDSKSPFTYGHSNRVALYTDLLAQRCGLSTTRRRWLKRAALLHDLGKLGVSNSILDKQGKLDEDEWQQVRRHPLHTEEILSRIGPFKELALVAGAHHERLDGTGYHKGLSGAQISTETRLITLSDIFDALTAERPYRGAMPIEQALKIMKGMCGTALDEELFLLMIDCMPDIAANLSDTPMESYTNLE